MTDDLQAHELVPVGGTWGGLLFENANVAVPLSLTWSFDFECQEVHRGFGSTNCSISVEWVPNMIPSWSDHGGLGYRCQEFAEPVEASVYFFSHHRYDKVELAIPAQQGSRLTANLKLTGDIDGLGLPSIHVRAELDFTGIIVHANVGVADIERDKQSLSRFTDASPLVGTPRGAGSLFLPATGSGQ